MLDDEFKFNQLCVTLLQKYTQEKSLFEAHNYRSDDKVSIFCVAVIRVRCVNLKFSILKFKKSRNN